MSKRLLILILVLSVLSVAYAIVLQATGQPKEAMEFVKYVGGGIATLLFFGWFFGI